MKKLLVIIVFVFSIVISTSLACIQDFPQSTFSCTLQDNFKSNVKFGYNVDVSDDRSTLFFRLPLRGEYTLERINDARVVPGISIPQLRFNPNVQSYNGVEYATMLCSENVGEISNLLSFNKSSFESRIIRLNTAENEKRMKREAKERTNDRCLYSDKRVVGAWLVLDIKIKEHCYQTTSKEFGCSILKGNYFKYKLKQLFDFIF